MFVKFLSKTASLKLNYHKLNLISKFSTNSTQNTVSLSYDLNDKYNSDKALVIAHGLFASKLSWRAIARRINDQTMQKVYTIDLRNHGNTLPYCESMSYPEMAGDLHNFVKTIVIEKDKCKSVSLLGHSMGGKTAMSLVLNDAQYIDKLIVADISPSISPSILNIKSFLIKMNEIDMNSLNPSIFQARKQVEEKLCELPALKADYNQRQFLLTRLVEQNGKIKWHFNLPSIINHLDEIMSFPNFNTKFNKPTLFVGGELSNYITEKDVPSIEKYFTNYKIVKIPKAGHVIHFDNPTDTIKTIDEFINKNIF